MPKCDRCGFTPWDGFSRHPYQGRESSGVPCFGPDERPAAKRVAVKLHAAHTAPLAIVDSEQLSEEPVISEPKKADIMTGKQLEETQTKKKAANPAWSAALDKLERKMAKKNARPKKSARQKNGKRKRA